MYNILALPDEDVWADVVLARSESPAATEYTTALYNPLTGPYPSSTLGMTYFQAPPTPRPLSPIDAISSSITVPEPSELQNILSSEDLSRRSSSHENEFQVWVNSRSEANAHQVNVTNWHFSSPAQDQK